MGSPLGSGKFVPFAQLRAFHSHPAYSTTTGGCGSPRNFGPPWFRYLSATHCLCECHQSCFGIAVRQGTRIGTSCGARRDLLEIASLTYRRGSAPRRHWGCCGPSASCHRNPRAAYLVPQIFRVLIPPELIFTYSVSLHWQLSS